MCDEKKCCERPGHLKSMPRECTAEQVKVCHGDAKMHPCVPKGGCHDPARLKDVPETCSPVQVQKCHGNTKEHPCA
jgi:hypothetical protein